MKNIIKIIILAGILGILVFSIVHTRNNIVEKELKEREEAEQFYEPITEEEEYEDSIITYEDPETEDEEESDIEAEETLETEVQ